jgi:hypothetical protein
LLIPSAPVSKSGFLVRRTGEGAAGAATTAVPTTVVEPGRDAASDLVAAAERVLQIPQSSPKEIR